MLEVVELLLRRRLRDVLLGGLSVIKSESSPLHEHDLTFVILRLHIYRRVFLLLYLGLGRTFRVQVWIDQLFQIGTILLLLILIL